MALVNPTAQSGAPAETILMRLEHVQKGLDSCHVLVTQIEERLKGPSPQAGSADLKQMPAGMHGMAMDLRSSVQTLTTRLEQLVGLLA